MNPALRRFALERGGLLFLVVAVTYIWLAPAHVVDGDNAEMSTLGTIGGAAHPTGYPLYLLWLRATSWLPGSSPAHTAAIATALLGAATILVLHAACRAWGARPAAASLAVALFAAAPVVLRIHTQAEVFALNDLVAAAVLWISAANGPLRGYARAAALGLVAGLGLSDHVTCVLIAPIGIVGVVRAAREARVAAALGLAALGLVVGLTPYAYLVATRENPAAWGAHLDSVHAVVRHFLREDYGGPGAFSPNPTPQPVAGTLLALAMMLGRTWLWLPLAIAVVELVRRIVRADTRIAWAALAVSFVAAGPVLASRFDVLLEGPGLITVQRFFLLPCLLLAIPCAVGLDRLADHAARFARFVQPVALVLYLVLVARALPYLEGTHSPAVEQGVRNMLRSLPQDAVVLVHDDDLDFGSSYLQLVLGERPDVTVVMWPAIGLPVYRERIERRLGIDFPPGDPTSRSAGFAAAVLASGRPVFVDPYQEQILGALPSYPFGILFRVLPRDTARPPAQEVFAINQAVYARFEFPYAMPPRDADWPIHVHERYARMWQVIRDELAAAGDRDDAATAGATAASYLPADYVPPAQPEQREH